MSRFPNNAVLSTLIASAAALSISSSAVAAGPGVDEGAYPPALLERACITSGAAAQMESVGGYTLEHLSGRITAMNENIEDAKDKLSEVGVAVCEGLYDIGWSQGSHGLWNELSMEANLDVVEMDPVDFNNMVKTATSGYSSPSLEASDHFRGTGMADISSGWPHMMKNVYRYEALTSALTVGSEASIASNTLTVEKAVENLKFLQNQDFGPGDDLNIFGTGDIPAFNFVLVQENGWTKMNPGMLEKALADLRGVELEVDPDVEVIDAGDINLWDYVMGGGALPEVDQIEDVLSPETPKDADQDLEAGHGPN